MFFTHANICHSAKFWMHGLIKNVILVFLPLMQVSMAGAASRRANEAIQENCINLLPFFEVP